MDGKKEGEMGFLIHPLNQYLNAYVKCSLSHVEGHSEQDSRGSAQCS